MSQYRLQINLHTRLLNKGKSDWYTCTLYHFFANKLDGDSQHIWTEGCIIGYYIYVHVLVLYQFLLQWTTVSCTYHHKNKEHFVPCLILPTKAHLLLSVSLFPATINSVKQTWNHLVPICCIYLVLWYSKIVRL